MSPAQTEQPSSLTASYASPQTTYTFTHPLSTPATTEKTPAQISAYLSELRSATAEVHEEVNAFLTARMEDDKARAEVNGAAKDVEAKEEENYGEEPVEDEETAG